MKEKPARVDRLESLAITYAGRGMYKQAIALYQRAISIRPEEPQLRVNLGLAYFKTDRFDDASREFARALIRDPKDYRALELLANCHYN